MRLNSILSASKWKTNKITLNERQSFRNNQNSNINSSNLPLFQSQFCTPIHNMNRPMKSYRTQAKFQTLDQYLSSVPPTSRKNQFIIPSASQSLYKNKTSFLNKLSNDIQNNEIPLKKKKSNLCKK